MYTCSCNTSNIHKGMTVTLMLRSVGAIIFGVLADRYGRKWPMIINLFLFIILELCSGFCQTLPQFLGVRALYGIAMGGMHSIQCFLDWYILTLFRAVRSSSCHRSGRPS